VILGLVGLVSTEDMVVMMDEMGIDTGVDVDKLLDIGRMTEHAERTSRQRGFPNSDLHYKKKKHKSLLSKFFDF